MGKGGKKAKTYKAPPDSKYLVVVDPWGTPGHNWFINNVAAWFEIMLMDDYPGEEVKTIFTQGTHDNIIVELPISIDIQPYIGSHHHAMFLKPPYDQSDKISYIYEYDYEKQNDPTRRSWTANYPSTYDVSIFPIKRPYPSPQPAPHPPYNVWYAKRPRDIKPPLPMIGQSGEMSEPATIVPEGTSSSSIQTQQETSRAEIRDDKQDPYEQTNAAESFLSSFDFPSIKLESDNHSSESKFRIKAEEPASLPLHSIKSEPENDALADGFLKSIIPPKEEETVEEHPSLQPARHVSVKIEQDISQEDYEPSAELMAAFADLPGDLLTQARQATGSRTASSTPASFVKNEETDEPSLRILRGASTTRVKDEPMDDFRIPPSPFLEQHNQRERSATLATEREETIPPSVTVKAEPRDDYMIPNRETLAFSKTRDPRLLKREKDSSGASSNETSSVLKTRDPRLFKREEDYHNKNTLSREPQPASKTRDPRKRVGDPAGFDKAPSGDEHPVSKTLDPRLLRHVGDHPGQSGEKKASSHETPSPSKTRDPRPLTRGGGYPPVDDKASSHETHSASKTHDPRLLKRGGEFPAHQPDDNQIAKKKRIKYEWET